MMGSSISNDLVDEIGKLRADCAFPEMSPLISSSSSTKEVSATLSSSSAQLSSSAHSKYERRLQVRRSDVLMAWEAGSKEGRGGGGLGRYCDIFILSQGEW